MAQRPFYATYAAAAVLLGLGAYIYFVESKAPENKEPAKEKLVSLNKAKVKELALEPQGTDAIRLAKDGSAWNMRAPLVAAADATEAEALLSTLENLEVDQVAAETPARLSDFGLDPPKLAVSAVLDGAKEPVKLLLGDKTPDGTAVY